MRAALGVILFFLTLYQGEALRCNFCFSWQSDLCTPTSIQTCPAGQNACADVIFQSVSASFRQCMNMALCQSYVTTPGAIAQCCSTDLCNWSSSFNLRTTWSLIPESRLEVVSFISFLHCFQSSALLFAFSVMVCVCSSVHVSFNSDLTQKQTSELWLRH